MQNEEFDYTHPPRLRSTEVGKAPRWLRGLAQAVMAGAFVAALAVIFLVVYALAEMVL